MRNMQHATSNKRAEVRVPALGLQAIWYVLSRSEVV